MRLAQVQFSPWDKIYNFSIPKDLEIKFGNFVIVETELAQELARVLGIVEDVSKLEDLDLTKLKLVLRLANIEDAHLAYRQEEREPILVLCHEIIKREGLKMRLIDLRFSLDNSLLTIAFLAEGRVDFRELLKELNQKLSYSIKLQQIGVRDAAQAIGDCGSCGRRLCCSHFKLKLPNTNADMIEKQQLSNRGSDRLSGICGRLKCCLSFENDLYEDLLKKLPPLGSEVYYQGQKARVLSHFIYQQKLELSLPGEEQGAKAIYLKVGLDEIEQRSF